MTGIPAVPLAGGVSIPRIGLGTWLLTEDAVEDTLLTAFECGYRSVDTASAYGNEAGVGRAIVRSGLPREELFVTTKLANDDHHGYVAAFEAFEASRRRLGVDYVDLYLVHWPCPTRDRYLDVWRALERLLADGAVRAIGVSNFREVDLARLVEHSEVVPAVNQIECHPWFAQDGVRAACARYGVAVQAWRPLAKGAVADLPLVRQIAAKHGVTGAQVVLRWHVQLGHVVIPKASSSRHLRENVAVFHFALDEDDMAGIRALEAGRRLGPDPAVHGA